ncbi:T9SS type A sorting domain-containing protein, partial [Tenacibaculum holothuriorum]|uniref:T9SS type A sorting domain-containing protein n=1 Tax=Tenacibaculum holothuriorum TaxID=1635173 RepID=UPI00117D36BA
PSELGNLVDLIALYFYKNQLTGNIPSELGNLTKVIELRFFDNQLTGTIPVELSKLTELKTLSFNNNQLSGEIPTEFEGLMNLENIYLYRNKFSGKLPNFSGLPNLKLLKIENNNFIFGDFEDQFNQYNSLDTFTYSPQDKFDEESILTHEEGENITLTSFFASNPSSPNNSYQWYKDGNAISGATSANYMITDAKETDAGDYILKVNNSVVTNLELERNKLTVEISEKAGNEDLVFDKDVSLFPNPSQGAINLKINNNYSGKLTVEVYDLLGKSILKKEYDKNGQDFIQRINFTNISNGIYLMKIKKDNGFVSRRIILSK